MKKKMRLLLLFVSLTLTLSMVSNTYSKYVTGSTGDLEMSLSKWQILVNRDDIVNNSSSDINFTPIITPNENILENTLAPTSTGYFDIEIDPSNVDLSFRYAITLNSVSTEIPDLIINKYEILDYDTPVSNPLNIIEINGSTIENTLIYNSADPVFKHNPFIIRIYFEWFDGATESSDDEADTIIGTTQDMSVTIDANVSFEQIL